MSQKYLKYFAKYPYYLTFKVLLIELNRNIDNHLSPCDSVNIKFAGETIKIERSSTEDTEKESEEKHEPENEAYESTEKELQDAIAESSTSSPRNSQRVSLLSQNIKLPSVPFGVKKFKVIATHNNMTWRFSKMIRYEIIRNNVVLAIARQLVTEGFKHRIYPVTFTSQQLTMTLNLFKSSGAPAGKIVISVSIRKGEKIVDELNAMYGMRPATKYEW